MATSTAHGQQLKEVSDSVQIYYDETIDPLAEQLMFSRAPDPGARGGHPLVLVIGNHSAGKSTLINYMLGQEVQHTGVAPTDDSFTILTHGDHPQDKDGDAVVSNPDLGFAELRKFGPELVSHVKLKARNSEFLEGLTLVDSPGMIDAASSDVDRTYDFTQVVRWFAEQADVVLLLFDPDKPGTTEETLRVMRDALGEMSHKLLLVLNKMDQFRNLHDFARAYGALCWNLSRVIPSKDVPLIYNIYIPGQWVQKDGVLPIADFDNARNQVLDEIRRAPLRRVDNILTRIYANSRSLHAHARVCNEAGMLYRRSQWSWRGSMTAVPLVSIAAAGGLYAAIGPEALTAAVGLVGGAFLTAGVLFGLSQRALRKRKDEILQDLKAIYERLYNDQYVMGDDADLNATWSRIKARTQKSIQTIGLAKLPKLKKGTLNKLEKIHKKTVPKLRADLHAAQKKLQ